VSSTTTNTDEKTAGRPSAQSLAGEQTRHGFNWLRSIGFLGSLEGCRVLEVGPKHGLDSRLLAGLGPAELVLIDLPSKGNLVREWLPEVGRVCPTRYVEENLLYLSREGLAGLGRFDLVWCTGVLYHNAEQLRLIRRLFDLCQAGGRLVLETATTRNEALVDLNVVEIHWPQTYRDTGTVTHLPSLRAVRSWLDMVGFADIARHEVYQSEVDRFRALFTASRGQDAREGRYYAHPGNGPGYAIGAAR